MFRKLVIGGVKYQAARFTGFGPVDSNILLWIQRRTGRGPLNLDRKNFRSPGLAYYDNSETPYLLCTVVGAPYPDRTVPKKIKPGKWVVISNDGETVALLKNEAFIEKYSKPDLKEQQESIQRYVTREPHISPVFVRAVRVTDDSIHNVIKLFGEKHKIDRYTVDFSDSQRLTIFYLPEPGVECEQACYLGEWMILAEETNDDIFNIMQPEDFASMYQLA